MGIDLAKEDAIEMPPPKQPGEWLEYSPMLTVLLVLLAAGWVIYEFSRQSAMIAISSLNTYNFIFIMLGLLLHWRPKRFLDAVVEVRAGDLRRADPVSVLRRHRSDPDAGEERRRAVASPTRSRTPSSRMSTQHLYPLVIGVYSAVLGFFIPSGGGKWLLEAPYVMQAANDLKVHLGWAVQVYNAAEALPNLINPFWMLPLLGVLGLKARDIVGFTFLQLLVHLPLVLFLLWALAYTLNITRPSFRSA